MEFDAALNRYLTWLRQNKNRSAATESLYRAHLVRFKKYLDTIKADFKEVDLMTIEAFTGPALHKGGLGVAGRSQAISAIKGFYNFCTRYRIVSANPTASMEHPTPPSTLPATMTLRQMEQLLMAPDLSTFKGLRDAAMMAFLFATGCRASGVINLVEENLVYGGDQPPYRLYAILTEKGKKQRKLPLNRKAELLLTMYLGHDELKKIDRTADAGKLIFVSLKNTRVPAHEFRGEKRRLSRKSVIELLAGYGEKLGLPPEVLHPHAARHAVGTKLYDAGVDVTDRQAFMGHSRADTLMIYTRMSEERLLRAADEGNPLARIKTPVDKLVKAFFPVAGALNKSHSGNKSHEEK